LFFFFVVEGNSSISSSAALLDASSHYDYDLPEYKLFVQALLRGKLGILIG
jgi:hypothetical protein